MRMKLNVVLNAVLEWPSPPVDEAEKTQRIKMQQNTRNIAVALTPQVAQILGMMIFGPPVTTPKGIGQCVNPSYKN